MKKKYDICKISDFIPDKKTIKEARKYKGLFKTIVFFSILPLLVILYYMTLPFAIINDNLGGIN